MTKQINFKLEQLHKTHLERRCAQDDVKVAEILRGLSIAYANGKIPQKILDIAKAMESAAFPERRGRPVGSTTKKRKTSQRKAA